MAWVMRWKKPKAFRERASATAMTPNWDNVLKATIFLRSISPQAHSPAMRRVTEPRGRSHSVPLELNRRSRYTPAVTKVEECTRALTGVGAAMAAGNHLLNGY